MLAPALSAHESSPIQSSPALILAAPTLHPLAQALMTDEHMVTSRELAEKYKSVEEYEDDFM